jgi:hypothetical protein
MAKVSMRFFRITRLLRWHTWKVPDSVKRSSVNSSTLFMTGIFLEDKLSTSSRMFEFVFKMFSEGDAAIPARGMGMIPMQLANGLTNEELILHQNVVSIEKNSVTTASGSVFDAKTTLIATNQLEVPKPFRKVASSYHSVTNMYFTAARKPFTMPLIALNALPKKLVNNIAVMDQIAPGYSRNGDALLSLILDRRPFRRRQCNASNGGLT